MEHPYFKPFEGIMKEDGEILTTIAKLSNIMQPII